MKKGEVDHRIKTKEDRAKTIPRKYKFSFTFTSKDDYPMKVY